MALYFNPRGSTSYGEEFGNLIHHAYPGHDFDDLMSGLDAVLEEGYADPDRLFVTGESGGGVLSSWIVGHTDRFRTAAVQKPVINWHSFVLYSDGPAFFYKYLFPGPPWEHERHYMERSPLAYVGNVTTPAKLVTGEQDWRTPISETEQHYAALQIRGVPTAKVRVPEATHGIAARPSHLIAKVAHILGCSGSGTPRGPAPSGYDDHADLKGASRGRIHQNPLATSPAGPVGPRGSRSLRVLESIQSVITRRARPMFPIWQWFWA